MRSLFIATKRDVASTNIAQQLIRKFNWREVVSKPGSKILSTTTKAAENVYLWYVDNSLLQMNYPDRMFLDELKESNVEHNFAIRDVTFLSKHAAASGTISLTVHPIGVPGLFEETRGGGLPGRCSPPSHFIAPLYRAILQETKKKAIDSTFQVTLEATHHGPHTEVPTCFVEIGSSENEWGNEEAGKVWADCLGDFFNFPARKEELPTLTFEDTIPTEDITVEDTSCVSSSSILSIEEKIQGKLVAMSIGGGHYVPRLNDMMRFGDQIHVGHALATYVLQDNWEGVTAEGVPRWKHILFETIQTTRKTYPSLPIVCYIDKRVYTNEQRDMITQVLEEHGITYTYKTTDVKKLLDSSSSS